VKGERPEVYAARWGYGPTYLRSASLTPSLLTSPPAQAWPAARRARTCRAISAASRATSSAAYNRSIAAFRYSSARCVSRTSP
jgi:hypothetical protein